MRMFIIFKRRQENYFHRYSMPNRRIEQILRIKKIDLSKLITVDLVCHGVPSQQYLSNYGIFTKKYKKKLII